MRVGQRWTRATGSTAHEGGHLMGMLSGLVKAGVAKKVLEEASKPQNQEKAKSLLRQVTSKRKKR